MAISPADYPKAFRACAAALAARIPHTYQNPLLLYEALTHASFANEHRTRSYPFNERIEFLGDSVLNFVTTTYIYREYPHLPEGSLTKLRAGVVCDAALCEYGRSLGIDACMLLGHGEGMSGMVRRSIISDATEALIASLFLDAGLDKTRTFVLSLIVPRVQTLVDGAQLRDAKSILHETVQNDPSARLFYRLIEESGPDHDKSFVTEVVLNDTPIGKGGGKSKRESEQKAAAEALRHLGVE